MTILFVGAEDSEMHLVGSAVVLTTAGHFRSQYARCALAVGFTGSSGIAPAAFLQTPQFAPASELWVTARVRPNGATTAASTILLELGKSGASYLRVLTQDVGGFPSYMQWQVRTGASTWASVGVPFPAIDLNFLERLDAHAVVHESAGQLRLYLGEALVVEVTGINTKGLNPGTTLDFVRFGSRSGSSTIQSQWTYWSEIIVADETTQKWSGVYTLHPTGVGAHNDLAGDYTDVDEIVLDDSDALVGDTAGQQTTMAFSDLPPDDTENVAAVVLSQRHSRDTDAPESLIGLWRIGSTTYQHPSSIPHGPGLGPVQHVWTLSPATSQPITRDEVNNGQFGPELDG